MTPSRLLASFVGTSLISIPLAACSGNSSPTADSFINASLSPGQNGAQCNFARATTQVQIGTATGVKPTPIADGNAQSGAAIVHVQCTVTSAGAITLEAFLSTAGSIEIAGTLDPASGTGMNVTTVAMGDGTDNWNNSAPCTVTASYQGQPITQKSFAAGRVWGHVNCPTMNDQNRNMVLVNGVNKPVQCQGDADFFFENCSQ